MWKTVLGIRINDTIDWNNINYTAVATILGVATLFLLSIRQMVV